MIMLNLHSKKHKIKVGQKYLVFTYNLTHSILLNYPYIYSLKLTVDM